MAWDLIGMDACGGAGPDSAPLLVCLWGSLLLEYRHSNLYTSVPSSLGPSRSQMLIEDLGGKMCPGTQMVPELGRVYTVSCRLGWPLWTNYIVMPTLVSSATLEPRAE